MLFYFHHSKFHLLGGELKSTTDKNDWKFIGTEDPIAFSCYGNSNGCWSSGEPNGLDETVLEMMTNKKWNNIGPTTRGPLPLICQKEVTRLYGKPRDDLVCGPLYNADCAEPTPYCKDGNFCSSNAAGTNIADFKTINVESGIIGCY